MNKSKGLFRKCAYCQHHIQQIQCCCHRTANSSQNRKKSKKKPHTLINQSSIRYLDETQSKFQEINFSNLVVQNSLLKNQNNSLKQDLVSLSHCINEERSCNKQYTSIPTSHSLKTQSQQILSDRLYISNKNLQEAILQVDCLSRQNKQLFNKNSLLTSQLNAINLENQELREDILQLKKKLQKYQSSHHSSDKQNTNETYKIFKQKYQKLKIQNYNLTQQLQQQQHQFQLFQHQLNKNQTAPDNSMSPQWIAETSNKLSFIEQKIDCAENRIKSTELSQRNLACQVPNQTENQNSPYFEIIHQMKKQIALSINIIHSKTRKFNSVFDTVGNVENTNIKNLICSLIEGFVESCINMNINVERQLNRKVTMLGKHIQNLLGKLQNFVLQIKNRELRKRSTSRSRVLLSNKSGLNSHSPNAPKYNKQNYNYQINSIDKSF